MNLNRALLPLPTAFVAFIAAAGALATAYIAEYIYQYTPCTLCLWQRGPLWLALGAASLLLLRGRGEARLWLGMLAALFAIELGIAIFHVGVEQHLWAGTSSCTVAEGAGGDAASLRAQLLGTPIARCDQVTWTFLGASMASWNILFSFAMLCWTAAACRKAA